MSSVAGIFPVSGGSFHDFPLLSSKIHYDLVDVQSLATLVLTYASNATTTIEAKYVCPLPADASVCSFKAVIDGKRTIKGIVKDKVKAKAEYNEAIAQGRTAALFEQNNVEIFELSLGNIHPKQVIDIYISLASLITSNGELDSLRLVFPCVITRRYGTPPNNLLSFGRSTKFALDFSASIQMTSHIKSITSPSHPVSLSLGALKPDSDDDFDPFKAHVALTSQDHLDKDIIIVITCQGLDKPRCTVESYSTEEGGEEFTDAYSLTLVPRFELPPLPKQEYIFLVDRSRSMENKMNAMRAALQIMLRSLPSTNTTFNIFSFGSRHDSLWPSSVAYGTESLKTATTYVDAMQSNYGGTEIGRALQGVLQTHTDTQNVPLTVFVLTDGETYDLSGVQSIIAQHVDKYVDKDNFVRIFCMGIGNSVSKAMCDLIARVGRGAVVYVGENEKPDKKLVTLLRAARGPVITNISIDWGVHDKDTDPKDDDDFELVSSESKAETVAPMSLFDEKAIPKDDVSLGPLTDIKLPPPPKVQQAPTSSSLPSLYPGFRTSLFAIIRRDSKGNSAPSKAVRVKGLVQGRPVELEVPVTAATTGALQLEAPSDFDKIKLLHVLAARALVQRFEDEGKKDGVTSDTLKAEVLRVAVRYGIASSETSFIAVDEEGVPLSVNTNTRSSDDSANLPKSRAFRLFAIASSRQYQRHQQGNFLRSVSAAPTTSCFGQPSSTAFTAFTPTTTAGFGLSYSSLQSSPGPQQSQHSHSGGTDEERDRDREPVSTSAPAPTPLFGQPSYAASTGYTRTPHTTTNFSSLFGSSSLGFSPAPPPPPPPPSASGVRRFSFDGTTKSADVGSGMTQAPPTSTRAFYSFDLVSCDTSHSNNVEDALQDNAFQAEEPLDISISSIARFQTFEGYFEDSSSLNRLLVQKDTLPPIPDVLRQLNITNAETVWRAIFCIAFLRTKFPEDESVWELIVEKGERWISDTLSNSVSKAEDVVALVGTLREEAKKYIV